LFLNKVDDGAKENDSSKVIGLLNFVGLVFAKLPLCLVEALTYILGILVYKGMPKRQYTLRSNLHHAFPLRPRIWQQRMAVKNCQRTVEMGLLMLALPHLSIKQLSNRIKITEKTRKDIDKIQKTEAPTLLLVPHFTLYEYLSMLPGVMGLNDTDAGAIYRPLKNPKLNAWIKKGRERFGLKLLARNKGLTEAREILTRNGVLAILYDQNARRAGTLMPFFGRIASTTQLPRILAQRHTPKLFLFHPRRLRFWHAEIHVKEITNTTPPRLMHVANQWLEQKLTNDDDICADWLWMHNRWRIQDDPKQRFSLSHRKKDLDISRLETGYRLWIRLDENPETTRKTIPLIIALRKGRPDAKITLLCSAEIQQALKIHTLADHVILIPPAQKPTRSKFFQTLREAFPDTLLLLTQSSHAEKEALIIKAPQRFGLTFPSSKRTGLTHCYEGDPQEPLTDSLKKMLRHFGLQKEINV
jgi:heptosyltransferase II